MDTTQPRHDDAAIDPEAAQSRDGVRATTERQSHDSPDHCGVGTVGRAVIDVTNDAGEHLLLINEQEGVALFPNETVDSNDEWLTVATETVEGQTGFTVDIDEILAVRTVEHVLQDDVPRLTTHRIVFSATATGGEIRDCKQTVDSGSDDWRAGWFDELPEDIETPPNGPANDFDLVLG
jgi:hypothetical protein